jgi:ATP-binding cassette subfamily F protein 3
MRTTELEIGYPGNPLFRSDPIELTRLECAALIGPNGTGKTTFLRTILEQHPPLAGEIRLGASLKISYFAQAHESLHPENTVLEELLNQKNTPLSEARNYLARYLFRGDDVYKPVSLLSGGERGRLALALLAREDANFLLLDEPTNHLDIPAQEVLQSVLEDFDGTILLVTHDRYLVNRLATQIWELQEGRLVVFEGSYAELLAERERLRTAVREMTPAEVEPESSANGRKLSKNEARRQRESFERLESEIHRLEERLDRLASEMQNAGATDAFDRLQSLSVEYGVAEKELETLLRAWEEMAGEHFQPESAPVES